MLTIACTVKRPDLSGRGVTRMLTAAADRALLFHRQTFLPRHFTRAALALYHDAYFSTVVRPPTQTLPQILAQLSPQALADWRAMQATARGAAYSRAAAILAAQQSPTGYHLGDLQDNGPNGFNGGRGVVSARFLRKTGSKLPLVHTGHLRERMLQQLPTFTGPPQARRMTLRAPYYVNFTRNRANKRDVPRALTAMRPDEQDAMRAVYLATIEAQQAASTTTTRVA